MNAQFISFWSGSYPQFWPSWADEITVHDLVADNLTTSAPVLGTPLLSENAAYVDALTAVDLVVGSPVLGSPLITQIHTLEALGLMVGVPVLGTPELSGSDIVLIDASEVGKNYRATLAKRNYTARL